MARPQAYEEFRRPFANHRICREATSDISQTRQCLVISRPGFPVLQGRWIVGTNALADSFTPGTGGKAESRKQKIESRNPIVPAGQS
jgi:hypothetical protein